MPFLFLSPSTQEFNPYITSENEEYWMNLIADEMEPYLRASAVNFTRNDAAKNAGASIRASNAGSYDLHLALHSNAAPVSAGDTVYRGIDIYYYPTSAAGLAMAQILADNLREIYPLPEKVRTLATTSIGEVRLTAAPAVLAELGYHDDPDDARWIEANTGAIARTAALSVTEYFGLPFLEPIQPRPATVRTQGAALNLRAYPEPSAMAYLQIPNGSEVRVYGEYDGVWNTVSYSGIYGYAAAEYLQ